MASAAEAVRTAISALLKISKTTREKHPRAGNISQTNLMFSPMGKRASGKKGCSTSTWTARLSYHVSPTLCPI
jgi:hypothetical protein